jgi:hypothetical protein
MEMQLLAFVGNKRAAKEQAAEVPRVRRSASEGRWRS